MSSYNAIQHIKRNVLILKGNTVIGRGRVHSITSSIAQINVIDDAARSLISHTEIARIMNNTDFVNITYHANSGIYLTIEGMYDLDLRRINKNLVLPRTLFTVSRASNINVDTYVESSRIKTPRTQLDSIFEGTRVVDEYRLSLGLVPSSFKDVPGYASNILQFEKYLLDPEDTLGLNND